MPSRINIPPLTRILLLVQFALSLIHGIVRLNGSHRPLLLNGINDPSYPLPFLTIVPAQSILYPWVFLIASLVEYSVLTYAISAATLFYGGKYLERAWSSTAFAKFLLVVALVPNILTTVMFVLGFAILRAPAPHSSINGGVAMQAAFLVAFKQLVPEHTVTIAKGIIKIRVKHFPALFLLWHLAWGILYGTRASMSLAFFGFLASWVYLRFYKVSFPDLDVSQPASLRGDASETFAFAYFFPEPLQTPIASVADQIYHVLIATKICTPFSAADVDASNTQAAQRGEGGLSSLMNRGAPAPGSTRAEAERRRALALKALDQRLHAATSKPAAAAGPSAPLGGSSMLGETTYAQEEHDESGKRTGEP